MNRTEDPQLPRSALQQQQGCVAECSPAPQILKSVKAASEVRNSVSHSAIIFANALMHCGTTVDSFLRDNLDWLSRATNWAKFSATAGLGVIHRGHLAEVRVLRLQLPQPWHPHASREFCRYGVGDDRLGVSHLHAQDQNG